VSIRQTFAENRRRFKLAAVRHRVVRVWTTDEDMTLARRCLFTALYVVSYTVLLKVRLNYLKFTENQDFTKG